MVCIDAAIRQSLPVGRIADEVNRTLQSHTRLVITAPPGAGKSTLLPLTIAEGLGLLGTHGNSDGRKGSGRLILLEPRRIAAQHIAARMAALLGEQVGETVGYRIRLDRRESDKTRILVVTEGILTRMLMKDATLADTDVVVFDEFHERNLHSDVALTLSRVAQQIIRDDLRIVVMSATIDADLLCRELDAPLIESEGRMWPVETLRIAGDSQDHLEQRTASIIREAHHKHDGDILVFLPGQREIERTAECLGTSLGNTKIYPLYGKLPLVEQQRALRPSQAGERKVVLATNIAETSLTIEGIKVVIDSGLHRVMQYDTRSGLSHLDTARISLDMADQRAGRAGRLSAGVCYRMWSLADEHRMHTSRTPEIEQADLCPMLLDLCIWQGHANLQDLMQLPWLTPPSTTRMQQAYDLLQELGATDDEGKVTPLGQKMSRLGCHPRIAAMLLSYTDTKDLAIAAEVAAWLERKDQPRDDALVQEYRRRLGLGVGHVTPTPFERGKMIAAAYPERIRRMDNGEWIAVADMDNNTGRIYLSEPVREEDLLHLIHERDNIQWDSRQGCIIMQHERRIGNEILEKRPITHVPDEKIYHILAQAALREGASMFCWDDNAEHLCRRIHQVQIWHPEMNLPDMDMQYVMKKADIWLPIFAPNSHNISQLRRIDMQRVVWSLLSYEQQCVIDRVAPSYYTVPTGSHIRIEYRQGAEQPILRVRLQECFGMMETPKIDDGRQAVLMELLSPGFKPVQLTQDLHSFWTNTYFEVRKELKRRYPKHAWPDNPMEATPTRTTKKTGVDRVSVGGR